MTDHWAWVNYFYNYLLPEDRLWHTYQNRKQEQFHSLLCTHLQGKGPLPHGDHFGL